MPELVITYRGVVYPGQCDHMGHMNVTFYMAAFDGATWQFFATLGITPSYLRTQKRGMAALQQRIAYRAELFPGEIITVRSGLLEIRPKVVRLFHEMRNQETDAVAAVSELIAAHTDTETRKACPFPEEIVRRAQEQIVEYEFDW